MKKLWALFMVVLVLFGCDVMDYNTMVCTLEGSNFSYEIQYQEDEIKGLYLIENRNVSGLSNAAFNSVSQYVNELSKKRNEVKGIREQVSINERFIHVETQIDYKKYDIEKDELGLMFVKFEKEDLSSVSRIREVLVSLGMQCDEIVEKELN